MSFSETFRERYEQAKKEQSIGYKLEQKKLEKEQKQYQAELLQRGILEMSPITDTSTEVVVVYKNGDAYAKDAARMMEDGWHVVAATGQYQRPSLGARLAVGLLARGKTTLVVTYTRAV